MFSRSLYVGTMTSARSRAASDDTSAVEQKSGAQGQQREQDGHHRHHLPCGIDGIVEVQADPSGSGRQRDAEERVIRANRRDGWASIDADRPPGKVVLGDDENYF